jgi:hypothetical protein
VTVLQSRVGRCGLKVRLLIGAAAFCIIDAPAASYADDAQEIALIKAQMRKLAAQVEAIEQRQARRQHSGAPRAVAARGGVHVARSVPVGGSGTGSVSRRPLVTDGAFEPAIRFSSDTPPEQAQDVSPRKIHDGGRERAGFEWMPDTTQPPATTKSNIDLSAASPQAITQTAVDTLPPIFSIGGISVRLGGFVELSNIWRDSNMTSGPATAWGNFPYANSHNHGLSEERLSSQLSRMSVLMEANPSRSVRLQAYVESDFAGAGVSSNSVQIDGYVPRLRQGYFTLTEKDWGFHLLMGQAWSLATNYAKGILPRHEQLPAVTDNNQIPGIVFTRVPQIRIGKDWNQKYWLGLSIEDPQATVAFSGAVSSGGTLPAAYGDPSGATVYYTNAGGVLLNSATQYSNNPVPDIILKGAVDTSFGHYEVFGLARWFRSVAVAPGATTAKKQTSFGGGVGVGMTMPLGTNKLQLTGNVLAGNGIGRYGPTQLPDTTFNGQGQFTPVPEIMGSLGLIGHPASSVLLYTYGGVESAGHKYYMGADGRQYGYGVSDLDLAGCDTPPGVKEATCSAQTHTLASFTAGGWWHFMQGRYGSVMAGLQYTYIRKFAYTGVDSHGSNVTPTTSGNTVYVTFRYFPFQ